MQKLNESQCLFMCVLCIVYCLTNPVIYIDILLLVIFICLFFSFIEIFRSVALREKNAIMKNIYVFFLYVDFYS